MPCKAETSVMGNKTKTIGENIIGLAVCLEADWDAEKEGPENRNINNKLPKRGKQGCTC